MSNFESILTVTLVLVLGIFFFRSPASACTSIVLEAEDGTAVYGRTMEWGTFDLKSRVAIVPRGYQFQGETPQGQNGIKWKAKYGIVGIDVLEKNYISDGMNEKGLVVGLLYLPGFAEYQPYEPEKSSISMGPLDLANYVLSNFATVEEVRAGLKKVRVVPVPEPALGNIPAPIHLTVVDSSGKAIVVEYTDKKLHIFKNPLKVMTNSPTFDWHMTNLRNYINLSAVAIPTKKIENLDFAPIGAGSGFLGIPGDYTPPSRFVRAVAYTQTARNTPDGDETIYEIFRILDNFNLPIGSAEGSDAKSEQIKGLRSDTQWTTASDTRNLKLYYHTQNNRLVRMVDLKKVDFSDGKSGIRHFPLDEVKRQTIKDVTPKQ